MRKIMHVLCDEASQMWDKAFASLWKILQYVQWNLNGSNSFGTMEIYSRHEWVVRATEGLLWRQVRKQIVLI